jgi:hypothetical protein
MDITITAGENLVSGESIYLSKGLGSKTAGRWYKTDGTLAYASTLPTTAIATANISTGATGNARTEGTVTPNQTLVTGSDYFVSDTAGALSATSGTNTRYMGRADSTTQLVLSGNPRPESTVFNLQQDFGAKLDGSDDSAAMTAALARVAAAGGGSIFIPRGVCTLASVVTVATDNTRIYGEGPGLTRIDATSSTGGILVTGNYCAVDSLEINYSGTGAYGVKFDNGTTSPGTCVKRPTMQDVKIKGTGAFTGNGLWLVNALHGSFLNLYLPCGAGTAVLLESSAFNNFTDLQITVNLGEGSPQWGDGITFRLQSGNTTLQADDNIFTNAVVEGVLRYGIYFTSTIPSGPVTGEPPARNAFFGGVSEGNSGTDVFIENGKDNRFFGMHAESGGNKIFHIAGNTGNHVNKFYGCSGQFDIDNPPVAQGIQGTVIYGHAGMLTIGGANVFGTQALGVSGGVTDSGTNSLLFQTFLASSPNAAVSYQFNSRVFTYGPFNAASAVQGSAGAAVTIIALPPNTYGTIYVRGSQSGTTNFAFYTIPYVNGTGKALGTPTVASAGGTQAQMTFSLSGSNLQAIGNNATPPSTVTIWIDYFPA